MKEYPEFETPPSMTAFTQAAEWLVDKLAWHELGGPFYYPITDATAPGYFAIIKKPMDLETIEKRIKEKVYSMNFNAVIADIKQIFYNCYTYNQDTSSVSQQADKFEMYILNEALPYVKKLLDGAKARAEANTDPNVEIHLSPIPYEVFKKCKTMIQRLLTHKASVWFREPVCFSFSWINLRNVGRPCCSQHPALFRRDQEANGSWYSERKSRIFHIPNERRIRR